MSKIIDIMSLYPKDMNIYGDSGNVLTVSRRLSLYGYEPVIHQYNQGDDWPEHVDLILGGGGQDTGQKKIIDDFYMRADLLRSLAADGTPKGAGHLLNLEYERLRANVIPPFWNVVYLDNSPLKRK